MPRPTQLTVESLERRDQMSVFGVPWANAQKLTLSFANDGVSVAPYEQVTQYQSNQLFLYTRLNANMSTAVWQEELLKAVYAWTAVANVNVGLIADNGQAFGPAGVSETVTTADIRVGSVDHTAEVLATSIPYHPLTGYRAGNLLLNAGKTFTKGGTNGTYDLYSVTLHEMGNVLGLADNLTDTFSARFGTYNGLRTGLNAADALAMQALYGLRKVDGFEGTTGNGTTLLASLLTAATDPSNTARQRLVADGDITTAADADVYKFTVPTGTTSLTVRLGTAGKSLLAGKVELLNAAGAVVGTAFTNSPLQGDTVLSATGLAAGTYYVRVTANSATTFAIGSYQLRVGFGYDPVTETKLNPRQQFGADNGTNNTLATATTLATTTGFTANTRYSAGGQVESLTDADFYRLTAPTAGGVMTLTVQGYAGLSASATVYNAVGAVVASDILLNWENGLYRAQVPATTGNAVYYVKLKVQDADWSAWTGSYNLDVDFKQPLAVRQTAATGTAGYTSRVAIGLDVTESTAINFALSMASTNTAVLNGVAITIYDSVGTVVGNLWTDGLGSVDTMTAFLKKGKYTVAFAFEYTSQSAVTASYNLKLAALSDPIDVYDPTVPPPTSPPVVTVPLPPASPPPPGFYDPWSNPIP